MMPATLVHRINVYWQKNHHEYRNEQNFGRAHVINKQCCDIFYCVISWYPLHSAKKTSKHFIKDPCWMEILIRAFQGSYIDTAILRSQAVHRDELYGIYFSSMLLLRHTGVMAPQIFVNSTVCWTVFFKLIITKNKSSALLVHNGPDRIAWCTPCGWINQPDLWL